MNKEHIFYDYVDQNGANLIKGWLHGDGKSARARFNLIIDNLEGSPPPGFMGSVWTPSYVYDLTGDWKGFLEIRAEINKKEYRLIGQRQNRNILLITWGYHDGKGWHTDITPGSAKIRVSQMITNIGKYGREHEI
ncbi:MAG: hypothetical protein ABIH70_09060 [Chloroflexota bacterium]